VIAEIRTEPNDPLKKALTHALACWAVVGPLWVLVTSALGGRFALDFHFAFLPAAHAVLRGDSPYSALGSRALSQGTAFLYPPLGAYLLAPFTVLPTLVADTLAVMLVAVAVPATLLLLGVRDWRCYAVAFLWWPTIIGIQTGNLTLPMLVGLALIWRYRDRPVVAGLAAGLVIALKLFFWPLLIWLAATRRYRTAALAALATALLVLAPWAGIGFAGLRSYPRLLSTVSSSEGPHSYSVAALLHPVVPSWMAASLLQSVLGAAVLLLVFRAGRRGRERDAFALAIVATLLLTPLLELHYLAALLVVVAISQRQFGVAWVAPLLIWGAPATMAGSTIQVLHVLVVAAAVIALALSDWPSRFAKSLRRPAERLGLPMRRGAGPSPSPP
jgi:hypothetical protein